MESIARKHVSDAELVNRSKGIKLRGLCRVSSWEALFFVVSCQRTFGYVDDLFEDKILII